MTDLEVTLISVFFSLIGRAALGFLTHAAEEKNREELRKK